MRPAAVIAAHDSNDTLAVRGANGVANGTPSDIKQLHASQMLPPADTNYVQMDKVVNRKLFNSILCCIRSARPAGLLRGSSPIRSVSLASSAEDNSASGAAGPMRNSSENGCGGIRYMNGVNAASKHHNRMLSGGYYRGPLAAAVADNGSNISLLPAPRAGDEHRKLLVIDLDETLVHSSFKPVPGADFVGKHRFRAGISVFSPHFSKNVFGLYSTR